MEIHHHNSIHYELRLPDSHYSLVKSSSFLQEKDLVVLNLKKKDLHSRSIGRNENIGDNPSTSLNHKNLKSPSDLRKSENGLKLAEDEVFSSPKLQKTKAKPKILDDDIAVNDENAQSSNSKSVSGLKRSRREKSEDKQEDLEEFRGRLEPNTVETRRRNSNQPENQDEFSFFENPELSDCDQLPERIYRDATDSFPEKDDNEGDDLSDRNEDYESSDEILDDENEIDVSLLVPEKFENRDTLKKEVIAWACFNKMSLSFKSKERENVQDSSKVSTMFCSRQGTTHCKFSLEFHCSEETNNYYQLTAYYNGHNHELKSYDTAKAITPEIIQKLIEIMSTTSDTPTITRIINKFSGLNFHWRTIYYQTNKLKEHQFGKISQDAHNLIKMLKKDVELRGGYYKAEQGSNQELLMVCYMTERMKRIINSFADVVIIDGSHGTN